MARRFSPTTSTGWVMVLPAVLEAHFQVELAPFEAEQNRPYL